MPIDVARRFIALVLFGLLAACSAGKQDFCRYLSLDEARAFDPSITASAMRQTPLILYCVWKAGPSDSLFLSLDRATETTPRDFLRVLAKNSPEENTEVVTLSDVGGDGAALFLGDGDALDLDFLVAQNDRYSVTLRANNVERSDTEKLDELRHIARTVLSRL
jgi:hypothetical protein